MRIIRVEEIDCLFGTLPIGGGTDYIMAIASG